MGSHRYDVAIIGSGFAGSILAWILAKHGRKVALIDSKMHPRFAIGESSTPLADMLLARLSEKHGLPKLGQLSCFGEWQKHAPNLACGKKRGFSYFSHTVGQPFSESREHESSLLVAASPSDERSDTHWYRRDTDTFFFQQAIQAGATDLSGHQVVAVQSIPDSQAEVVLADQTLQASYLIDASGAGGALASLLQFNDRSESLQTRTECVFGHFRGIESWSDQVASSDDPFDSDDAAQHHLLGDSWMWLLRFDNGITSLGVTRQRKKSNSLPMPTAGLTELLAQFCWQYPSLRQMLGDADLVEPVDQSLRWRRIQRLYSPVVSDSCWMLPTAAATIDPLHSTGIAHALAGVDRTVDLILGNASARQVHAYGVAIESEIELLDSLVAMAYQSMSDFHRFTAVCMIYFAGAIRSEERFQAGETPSQLWNGDDDAFVGLVKQAQRVFPSDTPAFVEWLTEAIRPWNTAGLLDPAVLNRYAYTATK